jgi:ABC-type sugar transport system ATPase subunit
VTELRFVWAYVRANLKVALEYRFAFWGNVLAMFLNDLMWVAFWAVFFTRFPAVRGYDGKQVVLGVRADDLYRADARPDLPSISAALGLVEALGSQSMAYFKVDNYTIKSEAVAIDEQLAAGAEHEESVVGSRPNVVADFPPHVQLQLGDEVAIGVDAAKIHFFDKTSGEPLR